MSHITLLKSQYEVHQDRTQVLQMWSLSLRKYQKWRFKSLVKLRHVDWYIITDVSKVRTALI